MNCWDPGVLWDLKGHPSLHCGDLKGNQVKKHELMSVIWINVVIDINGTDESEQIIDYTVHLLL